MLGVKPSYRTGFAQYRGMSEYPQLWNGLMGAWDMSLGATGNKVLDLSGKGNTGILTGGDVTWVSSKFGSSLNIPGSAGDYVDFGTGLNPTTGSFTVVIWLKSSNTGDFNIFLSNRESDLPNKGLYFRCDNDDNKLFIQLNDQSNTHSFNIGTITVVDGTYHQVGIVVNRSTDLMDTYVDDQLDASTDISAVSGSILSTHALWMGTDFSAAAEWTGPISSLNFYNRILTAGEIALLFQIKKRYAS